MQLGLDVILPGVVVVLIELGEGGVKSLGAHGSSESGVDDEGKGGVMQTMVGTVRGCRERLQGAKRRGSSVEGAKRDR